MPSDPKPKGAIALNALLSPEERSEKARRAALAGVAKRRAEKESKSLKYARLGYNPPIRAGEIWVECPVCNQVAPQIVSPTGVLLPAWHYPDVRENGYAPTMDDGGYCRGTRNDSWAWSVVTRQPGPRAYWGRGK